MQKINTYTKLTESSRFLSSTLMLLDDWCVVTVTGEDAANYLQGQFTVDINSINENQYNICAHCNVNGKTLSNLYLFKYKDGFAYIIRKSASKTQIKALAKYSIFSKIKIIQKKNLVLLGIVFANKKTLISDKLINLPNEKKTFLQEKDLYILWIGYPIERFLIVASIEKAHYIKKKFKNFVRFDNSNQWMILDIEANIPIIDKENIGKFMPQSLNLKNLNAINFNKGCYIGQELIAKTEFLNLNKKSMYCIIGECNILPKIGEDLELKIGQKWIFIGSILSFIRKKNNKIIIQAVLKNKLLKLNDNLRLKCDFSSKLKFYKS